MFHIFFAQSLGMTGEDVQDLIRTVDGLHSPLKNTTVALMDLDKVADQQLADTGAIWKKFGNQLLGLILLGLNPLTHVVQYLSDAAQWGYEALNKLPGPLRETIKYLGTAVASMAILVSGFTVFKSLSSIFGSLSKAGGLGEIFGLGSFGDITGGLGAALLKIGGPLGTVMKSFAEMPGQIITLVRSFTTLGGAWEVLGLAFETNPIGWVITAIAALGLVVYELWKHCQAFRDFTSGFFDGLVEGVKPLLDALAPLGELFEAVGSEILQVLAPIGDLFKWLGITSTHASDGISTWAKAGKAAGIIITDFLLSPLKAVASILDIITGKWTNLHDLWLGHSDPAALSSIVGQHLDPTKSLAKASFSALTLDQDAGMGLASVRKDPAELNVDRDFLSAHLVNLVKQGNGDSKEAQDTNLLLNKALDLLSAIHKATTDDTRKTLKQQIEAQAQADKRARQEDQAAFLQRSSTAFAYPGGY